jgi:hypothetical protein
MVGRTRDRSWGAHVVCLVARCVTMRVTIGQAICYSIPLGHCLYTLIVGQAVKALDCPFYAGLGSL